MKCFKAIRWIPGLMMSMLSLGWAQSWNSGSTGADGALDLSAHPAGTVVEFSAAALGFDPDHENVFNYTYVHIPAGVTLRMSAKTFNAPVIWLASDSVRVFGTLDLNGESGVPHTRPVAYPFPGSGGYTGGLGQISKQAGFGPAGGAIGACERRGCCDCCPCDPSSAGGLNANRYLVPLFGGSGGGGSTAGRNEGAGGGGAGGGAILIASSRAILLDGAIRANGGHGLLGPRFQDGNLVVHAGPGGGGAIKLVAPSVLGKGSLSVSRGGSPTGGHQVFGGSDGIVRIESFVYSFQGSISGNFFRGTPYNLFLEASRRAPPRIRVVSIGGSPVAQNPEGRFEVPDVVFSQSSPVTFQLEGRFITPGTKAVLYLQPQDGPNLEMETSPLEGTLQSTTGTATTTVPSGYSRGFIRVSWTP